MNYIQCEITHQEKVDVVWLPEGKAKLGALLKIRDKDPEGLWKVTALYSKVAEEKITKNRDEARDFKTIEVAGRRSYKDAK